MLALLLLLGIGGFLYWQVTTDNGKDSRIRELEQRLSSQQRVKGAAEPQSALTPTNERQSQLPLVESPRRPDVTRRSAHLTPEVERTSQVPVVEPVDPAASRRLSAPLTPEVERTSQVPVVAPVDRAILRQHRAPLTDTVERTSQVPVVSPDTVEPHTRGTFDFESFIGRTLLPVLGVLSVVVALGFFVSWTITSGLLTPPLQIGLAALTSFVLVGVADVQRHAWPRLYPFLSGIGLGGLMITTFLAHALYGYLTADLTLSLMILIGIVGVGLSLRYDSQPLAFSAVLAAAVTPFVLPESDSGLAFFLAYGMGLSVVAGGLAGRRSWLPMLLLGLTVGVSYVLAAVGDLRPSSPLEHYAVAALLTLTPQLPLFAYLLVSAPQLRQSDAAHPSPRQTQLTDLAFILLSVISVFSSFLAYVFAHTGDLQLRTHFWLALLPAAGLVVMIPRAQTPYRHNALLGGLLTLLVLGLFYQFHADAAHLLGVGLMLLSLLVAAVHRFGTHPATRLTLLPFAALVVAGLSVGYYFSHLQVVTSLVHLVLGGLMLACLWSSRVVSPDLKLLTGTALTLMATFWAFGPLLDTLPTVLGWVPFGLWAVGTLAAHWWQPRSHLATFVGLVGVVIPLVCLPEGLLIFDTPLGLAPVLAIILLVTAQVVYLTLPPVAARLAQHDWPTLFLLLLTAVLTAVLVDQTTVDPLRTTLWGLCAGAALTYGLLLDDRTWRLLGITTLCLVALKLYLVDVWQWQAALRIVAFGLLGVVFLGTGVLYRRRADSASDE